MRGAPCTAGHATARLLLLLGLLLPACGPSPDDPNTITVFAAASTADYVDAVADRFEETTGARVRRSYAATGVLARQIEQGADVDVFLSAHPRWMDHLERGGLLRAGSRHDLLENQLVLVVPSEHALGLVVSFKMEHDYDFAAAWPGRLAVGDPEYAPAGLYARQTLERLGWWDGVRERLVPASDVRAAVRLVERGETPAGIVYASDAVACPGVAVVATFPPESHDPIRYPVALTTDAGALAEAFLLALAPTEGEDPRPVFGFGVPPGTRP